MERQVLLISPRREDLADVVGTLGAGWRVAHEREAGGVLTHALAAGRFHCVLADLEEFERGLLDTVPALLLADAQQLGRARAAVDRGAAGFVLRGQWDLLEGCLLRVFELRLAGAEAAPRTVPYHDFVQLQNRRLQELYDLAPVGYLTLDTLGYIVELNIPASVMLDARADLRGWPLAACLSQRSVKPFLDYTRQILKRLEPEWLEVSLRRRRAPSTPVLLFGRVYDQYLYLAMTDQTERKMTADALLEARSTHQAIVNNLQDAVLIVSLDGFVHTANPAAERLLLSDGGRLLGSRIQALLPDESAPLTFGTREANVTRPDRSIFPALVSVTSVRPKQVRHCVVVIHDLTATRQAHREQARVAERERRRLGQDLHDDLGQQLTALAYVASVLEKKMALGADPAQHTLGRRVAELAQQAVSKIRGLARGMFPQTLHLHGLVPALRELCSGMDSLFSMPCEFEAGECPPLQEEAATHLYRLTQEALSNAHKHAHCQSVRVELWTTGLELHLTIEDDGVGIQTPNAGPGLGLFSMAQHAQLVGGTLAIGARQPQGTRIYFQGPLAGFRA